MIGYQFAQTRLVSRMGSALATEGEISERQSKMVKDTAKEKCKCRRCRKVIGAGKPIARISTDGSARIYHIKCGVALCKLRATRKFYLPPGGPGCRVIYSQPELD
jgi:hypothetical protein